MQKEKRFALDRKIWLLRASIVLAFPAIALLLLQPVLARTTYVITDGSRVLVHTTSADDPKTVLGEAGLKLDVNDTYTTQEGEGISEISVRRGQKLLVNYYGQILEVESRGESVEELLTRLELTWNEEDVISAPLDAKVYDGMELTVARVIRENQTYTAVLPHETIYCTDAAIPEGERKVLSEGEDGQMLCHAAVTYLNGVESQRTVLTQQVVTHPVNEIIAVGIGPVPEPADPRLARIGNGTITLPTGEVLTYTEKVTCVATAYHCEGYVGTTATGTRARVGAIAVDPEMFPYGTRFYIVTQDGEYVYGVATAEDCGDKRFIYGTRLDLFFDTKYECVQFGARKCDVYILG